MKTLSKISFALILIGALACTSNTPEQKPTQVNLLTYNWLFNTSQVPHSQLDTQTTQAKLSTAGINNEKGFTVQFTVNLKPFDTDKTILDIPNLFSVRIRQHDIHDRFRQNYPAFAMPDGSVPVLEAIVQLHLQEGQLKQKPQAPFEPMTIGIPLAMLPQPDGEHQIVLNFTGVRWAMYVDGELLDNDFPIGYPQWNTSHAWTIDPEYVKTAALYLPGIKPDKVETPKTSNNIQYWTPLGHNTWVGDVATFYHNKRYHIFYLFDRREHGSKLGCGGHYFEHISTTDFKTWTEHEAATPIEEQWETIGTGVPFLFDGKLCLSYGLHTTRIYPEEMTTLPAQWAFLKENGYTGSFHRDSTVGFPAGSTYSISEDGVSKFKKTGVQFHPCENPSVYTDPTGKLRMLANYRSKGTWESSSVDGGWRCIDPEFPLGGDCTFYFRWGQFDYILGGFDRLWSKHTNAPENSYEDMVSKGLDFYNGLCVPAISEIDNGRFLMAGWMQMRGWGGPLIIHELIQLQDGRIGTKWMPEVTPLTENPKTLASKLSETKEFPTDAPSFMLTFDVVPSKGTQGKLGILLLPADGEKDACELQINLDNQTAQFNQGFRNAFSENVKSLRQGGAPQQGRNYGIEQLLGTDQSFTVRLIVKGSDKFGGTLLDAEIAGQRTMISYRPNLHVKKMLLRTDKAELRNVQIARIP